MPTFRDMRGRPLTDPGDEPDLRDVRPIDHAADPAPEPEALPSDEGGQPEGAGSAAVSIGKPFKAAVAVPDIPGPMARLCWKASPGMTRCDRRSGHLGPHTWEMVAKEST